MNTKERYHYIDSLGTYQEGYNQARRYLLDCRLQGFSKELINRCICHLDDEIRDIVGSKLSDSEDV